MHIAQARVGRQENTGERHFQEQYELYRILDMFEHILMKFSVPVKFWDCYMDNYTKRRQILTPENQTEEKTKTKKFAEERTCDHCIL